MGFKVPTRVYRLVFDEPSALAGLEVSVKTGTAQVFMEMSKLTEIKQENVLDPETLGAIRSMLDTFSGVLVSWNAEDEEGNPLPCNIETLCQQDLVEFVMPIIGAWLTAITSASPPLTSEKNSQPAEDTELEQSIPMQLIP